MKRFYIALAGIALAASPALADLNGNGYYRIKNYGTDRWAAMVDNKGTVDIAANTADLHSMLLTSDTEQILSMAGSIIYIENIEGNEYNLAAQGLTLRDIVNYPIKLMADAKAPDGQTLYRAFGTYMGFTKFIGDGNLILSEPVGNATIAISNNNSDFVKWYILPLDPAGDNFFGAVPDLNIDGKLYTTLFTSFAYSPYSEGVTSYYIGRVGFGMAEMIEVDGAVPAGSPVIIECAGETVYDNRLQIETLETALPNNSLSGVYFNYANRGQYNQTPYDPKTMRVLGKCSDGSLGFVTSDIEYLPANQAYLIVPQGSSAEFKCVTTSEYEANIPEAPEQIYLIGSMQGWDFNDSSMPLLAQGDYTYSGTYEIPAAEGDDSNVYFRFFTALGDAESNSIGAESDQDVAADVVSSMFAGPYVLGSQTNWYLQDWTGGDLTVNINLQYQFVYLSSTHAGISNLKADSMGEYNVYDLQGRKVAKGKEDILKTLDHGLYIINGKKVIIK